MYLRGSAPHGCLSEGTALFPRVGWLASGGESDALFLEDSAGSMSKCLASGAAAAALQWCKKRNN